MSIESSPNKSQEEARVELSEITKLLREKREEIEKVRKEIEHLEDEEGDLCGRQSKLITKAGYEAGEYTNEQLEEGVE
jgi:hypothetical protein